MCEKYTTAVSDYADMPTGPLTRISAFVSRQRPSRVFGRTFVTRTRPPG